MRVNSVQNLSERWEISVYPLNNLTAKADNGVDKNVVFHKYQSRAPVKSKSSAYTFLNIIPRQQRTVRVGTSRCYTDLAAVAEAKI